MDIKLMAVDMDGTLLYSKHDISRRVKEAVAAAAQKGVKVVISTGRIYSSARYYSRLLGVDTAIISCNGAFIKEHENSEIIYKCSISGDALEEIVQVLQEYNDIYYNMYSEKTYYAKEYSDVVRKYLQWNESQPVENKINIEIMEDPKEIIARGEELFKIYLSQEHVPQGRFNELIKCINYIHGVYCVSSMALSVDVINTKVNKGNALRVLSERYNIHPKNIMAIGDNYNDLEMITFAGLGVAMGNAENEVKNAADYVTSSNMEDGVALAIEKFIL
ncbi:MAG: Cof-type HAD-IIB family hydrolase [Eubacteriales bacterium]